MSLMMLRRGIECDPDNAELYRKLGDHLLGKGKIDDAREIYEKGIEANEMYAPLYHSLAELEARICNLDALAKLNERTNNLFNNNAMEPSPGSQQVLERKRKKSNMERPVSSFFVDRKKDKTTEEQQPPKSLSNIEELNGEGIVADIMSVESILNDTTTKMD